MLSNVDIKREMENGNIVIIPFKSENLGANSYDVTLGNWFVELHGYDHDEPIFGDFIFVPDGKYIYVPPGGTMLGMTKEVCGSQYDIIPAMRTRSSIRRAGIDICASAGLGDIGYINHWTIELTSFVQPGNSTGYAPLMVGSRIGQIVFDRAESPANPPYRGQYNSHEWPLNMLPKNLREKYKHIEFNEESDEVKLFTR